MERVQPHTSYHNKVTKPKELRKLVRQARQALKNRNLKPDVIVARGISGITFGAALSYSLGIPLTIIRKPGESSHGQQIEGHRPLTGAVVLWVDDFVCSGATMDAIADALHTLSTYHAFDLWAYCYAQHSTQEDTPYCLVKIAEHESAVPFNHTELYDNISRG